MLMYALRGVRYVGDLPLQKQHVQQLATIFRHTYPRHGQSEFKRAFVRRQRPALLVITMVFTARYFQGNEASFWGHYLEEILRVTNDQQNWQTALRECFRQSLTLLERSHPHLWKPVHDREVVRAIYSHAVIPQYVEDDFARLVLYWRENQLHTTSAETILNNTPPQYLETQPEPLKKFLSDVEFSDARISLIDNLLAALQLLDEIDNADAVRELMISPIQRAIWRQIETELKRLSVAREVARKPASPYWVWDGQSGEILVVLPPQSLSKTTHPRPAFIKYRAADRDVKQRVYPWETSLNWTTERIMLPHTVADSFITFLDQYERTIHKVAVPPLPRSGYALFRLETSGDSARLETDQHRGMNDGEYWLSYRDGINLIDGTGNRTEPVDSLYVPAALRKMRGHSKAGRFELRFPVELATESAEVVGRFLRSTQSAPSVKLSGNLLDETLSADLPPVYADPESLQAEIVAPGNVGRELSGLLRLGKAYKAFQIPFTSDGRANLDLGRYLPKHFGTFELQLFAGVRRIGESLRFAVAPGLEIAGPSSESLFSPLELPKAIVAGDETYSVQAKSGGSVVQYDSYTEITWSDLETKDVGLVLSLDGESVEIQWTIRRVWAWLEGCTQADREYRLDDLDGAVIQVRGPSKAKAKWRVARQTYDFELDARGEYHNDFQIDSLREILRHMEVDCDVCLSINQIDWCVFRFTTRAIPSPSDLSPIQRTVRMSGAGELLEFGRAEITQGRVPLAPANSSLDDTASLSAELRPYRTDKKREQLPTGLLVRVLNSPVEVYDRLEMPALLGDPTSSLMLTALTSREGIGALDAEGMLSFVIDREYTRT
ncbi:MAG: hypothetical protein UZ13_02266, partial [Chloroflexi bacterium OLB13]